MTEEHPRPFDERAALAELERLHEEREAAREAHKRKAEEFDRFIQSFRTPPSRGRNAERVPEPLRPVIGEAAVTSTESGPDTVPMERGPDAPRATKTPHRWRYGTLLALGAAAVVVIALAVPRSRLDTSEAEQPPTAAPSTAAESAPATAQAPTPPPTSAAPPATVTPAGVRIELRAAAAVWVRVVVDGETKVERLVAGGERLSFAGQRSIVVRAGNAGDLFVKTDDREVPFGVPGQPLTRTFGAASDGPRS